MRMLPIYYWLNEVMQRTPQSEPKFPKEPVKVLYRAPPEDVETIPVLLTIYDSKIPGHQRHELRFRRVESFVWVDDSDDDDPGDLELALQGA